LAVCLASLNRSAHPQANPKTPKGSTIIVPTRIMAAVKPPAGFEKPPCKTLDANDQTKPSPRPPSPHRSGKPFTHLAALSSIACIFLRTSTRIATQNAGATSPSAVMVVSRKEPLRQAWRPRFGGYQCRLRNGARQPRPIQRRLRRRHRPGNGGPTLDEEDEMGVMSPAEIKAASKKVGELLRKKRQCAARGRT
jgi:hypothetical protein